jgi:cytochrome c-type biogenesis protein
MTRGAVALALTSGMLAAINPCGFAMLPAYLAYFVGAESDQADVDRGRSVRRAVLVSLAVTSGFVVTFTAIGLIVVTAGSAILRRTPWITIVIGLTLVGLGIALLAGWHLNVRLPRFERGGWTRGFGSMALFGVSYAVASLGCTLPTFLAAASGVLRANDVTGGLPLFVAYALGMGLVITGLTVAVAMARHSLVRQLRRALPYVQRIAGGLLVLAGGYVAYYGWYELRVYSGDLDRDAVVDTVTGVFDRLRSWAIDLGGPTLATVFVVVIAAGVLLAVAARRRPGSDAASPIEREPVGTVAADAPVAVDRARADGVDRRSS